MSTQFRLVGTDWKRTAQIAEQKIRGFTEIIGRLEREVTQLQSDAILRDEALNDAGKALGEKEAIIQSQIEALSKKDVIIQNQLEALSKKDVTAQGQLEALSKKSRWIRLDGAIASAAALAATYAAWFY